MLLCLGVLHLSKKPFKTGPGEAQIALFNVDESRFPMVSPFLVCIQGLRALKPLQLAKPKMSVLGFHLLRSLKPNAKRSFFFLPFLGAMPIWVLEAHVVS